MADDKEMSAPVMDGNDAVIGHIISTTIWGKNGEPKGKPVSSVSKSIGVLDLGKKKSVAKHPRRLSIQSKSSASPASRAVGTITPISEARTKRSLINQGKINTPLSAVAKSLNGKESNRLFSTLYWLSQIKLSESVAKHSISLGFFKLALEPGFELCTQRSI